jgi:hypothetical protein
MSLETLICKIYRVFDSQYFALKVILGVQILSFIFSDSLSTGKDYHLYIQISSLPITYCLSSMVAFTTSYNFRFSLPQLTICGILCPSVPAFSPLSESTLLLLTKEYL